MGTKEFGDRSASELGTRFVDDVAEAIARFCTRAGATVDEVAGSFCDINGHTPSVGTIDAALAVLAYYDLVRVEGDRYFWHETDDKPGARR